MRGEINVGRNRCGAPRPARLYRADVGLLTLFLFLALPSFLLLTLKTLKPCETLKPAFTPPPALPLPSPPLSSPSDRQPE